MTSDACTGQSGYSCTIDISHMKLVSDVLKESHFIDADWFELGMGLNLPYPGLASIRARFTDPSQCLLECLGLWLTSANNRTWESLASALERMNQYTAATLIHDDPASQILQHYSDRISQVSLTDSCIQLLYTEGLVTEDTQRKIERCGGTLNKVPLDDEFKKYLLRCFPGLSDDITSVDAALDAVERKCSIINTAPLEAITNHYNITEAKKMVQEYKKSIKEFCSEIKVKFMLNKKLSLAVSSLTCERVEFVLEWKPDEHTLDDIRRLLEKAFEDLGKRIIVRSIHRGNSIIIICYAPHHLLAALLLEAQDNLTVLMKEFSLIRLTIGHYTVYNKRIRYKVLNNECLAEEIKLSDEEEQELKTLLDYKEGSIFEQDKQLNIIKKRRGHYRHQSLN
ncbi:PREDICTED: uncharacterized protein LOC109589786 [Amphimedon queenslandica]|uniref:Death domain-containing protein n=1 Tax=Amphimedon queenslandica TaxID=400682 RepID=A0AAN0JWT2_AMPQE|nr:PREDICTED: uncharacterized protein LOC109589786 [Amphimedon queenslandica]|eukprot:XP_019861361.1 PREDICTED: uncharacterized protein LOC109589786 [Amphimedon queenslandica]